LSHTETLLDALVQEFEEILCGDLVITENLRRWRIVSQRGRTTWSTRQIE